MKNIPKYLLIPATVTIIFFIAASIPVEILGCRNRGLIAGFIAIFSGILGIVAAVRAVIDKVRGKADSSLWMASSLILAIPAIFIILIST